MLVDIILIYNDYESAENLLESMKGFSCFDKIVVVDNCSPNGAFEVLKKYRNDYIHVIQTEKNGGVAYGNNYGAKYALRQFGKVDFFLFSNPDIIVEEKCINELVDFLRLNEKAGAVAPLEYDTEGEIGRDFAWKMPKYHQFLLAELPVYVKLAQRSNKPYIWYYDVKQTAYCDVLRAEVIISCFIMVRFEAYEQVEGFGENTFLYNEENIFSWKLHKFGWDEYVLTKSKVIHLGCTSMSKSMHDWEKHASIIHDSDKVFMRDCLNVNIFGLFFFDLIFRLSVCERKVYRFFKNCWRGKDEN